MSMEARIGFVLGVLVTAFLATAVSTWLASSLAAWSGFMALIGIYVVLLSGFSAFSPWFPKWVRRCAWTVLVAVVCSAARAATFQQGSWNASEFISFALLVVALVLLLINRRRTLASRVSVRLVFPVPEGEWYISQGGGPLLNHHVRVPAQRGALDLIRLRSDGRRAAGLFPSGLSEYAAYNSVVVSPCDGVVTEAVDGIADATPMQPCPATPMGNHVVIETGRETVVLAHLQNGSVLVQTGDEVSARQPIGRVGNSGNSTEPHLHIHAERAGLGLQLAFSPPIGRLHRGRRIHPQRLDDVIR